VNETEVIDKTIDRLQQMWQSLSAMLMQVQSDIVTLATHKANLVAIAEKPKETDEAPAP
jgi:hypothetical protein